MAKPKVKYIAVRIDKATHSALATIAKKKNMSIVSTVRGLIEYALTKLGGYPHVGERLPN